jgi:GNAT superfamily N-acetyltransferase
MATLDDLETLVKLRLDFSREVGDPNADKTPLAEATRQYLASKMPEGQYRAWVAELDDRIVGVGGLVLFERPPTSRNLSGLEAYITSMFTVPDCRGKGVATALLREIMAFVRGTDARRTWLRATKDGRPVYEKAGFLTPTAYMELFW